MKNRHQKTDRRAALAGALAVTLASGPGALALDGLQGDYVWPGDGFNTFLIYNQYARATSLSLDGPGAVPGSRLAVPSMTLRAVTYNEIGGYRTAFQLFLPMANFADARIAGADQMTSGGVGDLHFGASFWPVVTPGPTGTTLGLSVFLGMPTGNHRIGDVSIGSGTWTLIPQIGLAQGLGGGFYLDAIADVAITRDRSHDGVEVATDPSWQVQTYLRYQFSPTTSVAAGYSGKRGGKRYLDGVYTGGKTDSDQIRIAAGTFLTDKTYVNIMIGKDVSADGGFGNDFVGLLRIGHAF